MHFVALQMKRAKAPIVKEEKEDEEEEEERRERRLEKKEVRRQEKREEEVDGVSVPSPPSTMTSSEDPQETDALRGDEREEEGGRRGLPYLRALVAGIERANKMLLDRVRQGTHSVLESPRLRRLAPLLLLLTLIVYVVAGASAFRHMGNVVQENRHRLWLTNLAINRRHFARSISGKIFNDTRNLLIIIDREQTERVQQILVDSLKQYEGKVSIEKTDGKEWNFINSFNYAYALLLTLSHNCKMPPTRGGQVFSLVYLLFGIPLFFTTLVVFIRSLILPCWGKLFHRRRVLSIGLSVLLLVAWILLFSLFLHLKVESSFWTSFYTAVIASVTLQVNSLSSMSPWVVLAVNGMVTVSVWLLILVASLVCLHCRESMEREEEGAKGPVKFAVVVDEAGESHLAKP